jgi:hypothetical protein
MQVLAYLGSAVVLVTYFVMVRKGIERPFHWANALAFPPLLATEIAADAYAAMVLTVSFGILGWIGVLRGSGKSPDVDVSELIPESLCDYGDPEGRSAPLVQPETKQASEELRAFLDKQPFVIDWKAERA